MGDNTVIPVQVIVRVRPFNNREIRENARECVQCFVERNQINCNGKLFTFDSVYDPSTQQELIFESGLLPLLVNLFKGFHCTVLAYGQTGSGKTHTMGTEETRESMLSDQRGLIPRIVDKIFAEIAKHDTPAAFTVQVSMFEIYDEKVLDLLSENGREERQIRETKDNGVFVQGLTHTKVTSLLGTMSALEKGCQLRSKGETAMNLKSSRSHAVFTITIEKTALNDQDSSFTAKLNLVDLAGSERLKKTQAEGERMKEGIKINEGLLALGNVISALAESGGAARHIPYRDSKITRILQDSLGGNSYTMMIACVSPADTNAEETLSTLRYADRAKKIKNKPTVNVDPSQLIIQKMREELLSLRRELAVYRAGGVPTEDETGDLNMTMSMPQPSHDPAMAEELARVKMELAASRKSVFDMMTSRARMAADSLSLEQKLETASEQLHKCKELLGEEASGADPADVMQKMREVLKEEAVESGEEAEGTDAEDEEEEDEGEMDEGEADEAAINNHSNKLADRQATLLREMEAMARALKEKEALVDVEMKTQQSLGKMHEEQRKEMDQLQKRIDEIEQEKKTLAAEIKRLTTTNKLSEDRRRRLIELEKEMTEQKKRLREMKNLEKMKVQSDESVKRLRQEILEMKTMRVKMMKQLKAETDKFRVSRLAYDKQLAQMKSKERKREVDAARAEKTLAQQLVVCRRKYEEAAACNKRLQQQFAKTGRAQEKLVDGRLERQIKSLCEDELNLIQSKHEARIVIETLTGQRANLSRKLSSVRGQITKLQKNLGNKKRRSTKGAYAEDDLAKYQQQAQELEKEVQLCTAEIADLQSRCASGGEDEEGRDEARWHSIHTMPHAKAALKVLFAMAAADRVSVVEKARDVEEAQRQRDEKTDTIATMEAEHRQRMAEMSATSDAKQAEVETLNRTLNERFGWLLARIQQGDTMNETRVLVQIEGVRRDMGRLGSTVSEMAGRAHKLRRRSAMPHSSSSSRHDRSARSMSEEVIESTGGEGPTTRSRARRSGTAPQMAELAEADDSVMARQEALDKTYHPPTPPQQRVKKTASRKGFALSPIANEPPADNLLTEHQREMVAQARLEKTRREEQSRLEQSRQHDESRRTSSSVTFRRNSPSTRRDSRLFTSEDQKQYCNAVGKENVMNATFDVTPSSSDANRTFDMPPSDALNATYVKEPVEQEEDKDKFPTSMLSVPRSVERKTRYFGDIQ